jgi:hypothetical protein
MLYLGRSILNGLSEVVNWKCFVIFQQTFVKKCKLSTDLRTEVRLYYTRTLSLTTMYVVKLTKHVQLLNLDDMFRIISLLGQLNEDVRFASLRYMESADIFA